MIYSIIVCIYEILSLAKESMKSGRVVAIGKLAEGVLFQLWIVISVECCHVE